MQSNKSRVKSQKWLTVFVAFGVILGADLPSALEKGPVTGSLTVREAYGSVAKVNLEAALRKNPAVERVDLGQAFIYAFETNDETTMKNLVKENKNAVSKELVSMITYATSSEVKPEEMTWLIRISDKMAGIYRTEFSDKRLTNFVANYKEWSKREQERKKDADRIFYSYKNAMENKDYDAVVEIWDKSLDMYKVIGDRLGEARRLNEIGVTFGKLGSFQTSIKFLKDAREINSEIGNTWGEISNLRYIAAGYTALEDYSNAVDAYKAALSIVLELGDSAQKDILLNDIVSIEGKMKHMADME